MSTSWVSESAVDSQIPARIGGSSPGVNVLVQYLDRGYPVVHDREEGRAPLVQCPAVALGSGPVRRDHLAAAVGEHVLQLDPVRTPGGLAEPPVVLLAPVQTL